MKQALRNRLTGVKDAEDGTTVEDWVDRCYWEKRAEDTSNLFNQNVLRLEEVLRRLGILALPDQRSEIYSKLLALVQKLSGPAGITACQVGTQQVNDVLKRAAEVHYRGSANLENLERKLRDAGLPTDVVEGAKVILRTYQLARLESRYSRTTDFSTLEAEVIAELNLMKGRLDTGQLAGGIDFHAACLESLEDIWKRQAAQNTIPKAALQAMMYFSTNRCIHRFSEAKP